MSMKHSSSHTCQHTKVAPSSSLYAIIIGTTLIYIVSTSDSNFFLFVHSSSNANSKSGLDDAILDKN